MAITRKQVAQYAGVSESTVSYVINNGPRSISAATRQRVLDAIKALGYQPNAVAQSLRRQQTTIIGLIVPDTANPFYGEIARVIENACDGFGYVVMVCNSGDSQTRTQRYLAQLVANRVAGIMYVPSGDHDPTTSTIALLSDLTIPTIVLDYVTDTLPYISGDQVEMGYIATRHLLDLGHRRIAYAARNVHNPDEPSRYTGYQRAIAENRLPLDPELVIAVGEHPEDGITAGRYFLDMAVPPTAVFAHNDMNAFGIIRAFRERGLNVPDDLSVVGCDNISFAAYFDPPLTTVAFSIEDLGRQAVEQLTSRIDSGDKQSQSFQQSLPARLIVRSSTAAIARK
jgi:LacI family transcriptional regulator